MARGRIVKSKVKAPKSINTRSLESQIKKAERRMKRDLKKEATKASRALVKENKVTKKRATGKYYSNITKKEYDSYEKAHAAGEIYKKKVGSGRYILPTKSALYNQYLEDALEKRALEKARREERKAAKALQKAEEAEVVDEIEDFDESEWEDVELEPEQEEADELWVTWDDVKYGVLGNYYYWRHESGSWLYEHGYQSWDLVALLDDPYTRSPLDNHSNIDFIEQALKDSQYSGIYELRNDGDNYSIVKK